MNFIRPTLDKYFEYHKIFDLFDYDENLTGLYNDLSQLRQPEYKSNYRFIFLHYDTDYYVTNDQPGILLRNLQRIVWSLDISNYFCLILSQQRLQDELDKLALEETNDTVSIACITHSLQHLIYLPQQATNINANLVDKHYICLNRMPRTHRACLVALLQHNQLLNKGLVSYGAKKDADDDYNNPLCQD
jgi:hypothetical protein